MLSAFEASAPPLLADDGAALGPSQLFEIFVGLRALPAGFDLRIQAAEAPGLSAALAELFTTGRPWRLCREPVLVAYPVEKRQRRVRFAEVMAGKRDFNAEELDAELNDLRLTLAALGATQDDELSADQFLELPRQKARLLVQPGSGEEETDLAEAIRRQLQAG